jgi:hypothetical protein
MSDRPVVRSPERVAFDQLARAIHASYLSRWNRHDPAGLKLASKQVEKLKEQSKERSSAA